MAPVTGPQHVPSPGVKCHIPTRRHTPWVLWACWLDVRSSHSSSGPSSKPFSGRYFWVYPGLVHSSTNLLVQKCSQDTRSVPEPWSFWWQEQSRSLQPRRASSRTPRSQLGKIQLRGQQIVVIVLCQSLPCTRAACVCPRRQRRRIFDVPTGGCGHGRRWLGGPSENSLWKNRYDFIPHHVHMLLLVIIGREWKQKSLFFNGAWLNFNDQWPHKMTATQCNLLISACAYLLGIRKLHN